MARNDGIDRTSVRNLAVSDKAVGNTQQHNEREKDSYRNPDIIPQRAAWNVHFKKPTASYTDLFAQLEAAGTISTRGLKQDATHYCELVFDVNSAYFDNHGGYEFAKQFYEDAYKAAVQIVGGEQYILSAVMHADEINRAMTEALGREVYHYHLHVVYVPVVEKQILWSKRCKDEALRGTIKEVITQVSRSKKWESKPVLGEDGNPMLNAKGKKILKSSYSVLQDDFFHFMRVAGYTDLERGERGSTEEHLTVTQFKVAQEQQRLEDVTAQIAQTEQALGTAQAAVEKKQKEEQQMRDSIEVGDEITTIGGIVGRVVTVKDDSIIIETGADRNKIKIMRWAISTNNTANEKLEAERAAAKEAQEAEKAARMEEAKAKSKASRKKSKKNI